MSRKRALKLAFALTLAFMAALVGYRVSLVVHRSDYTALNAEHLSIIEKTIDGRSSFRFAVVGNIRNSMQIFNERLMPLIRQNGADFIISAGNAVVDGSEVKYRLMYRGLERLDVPYLLVPGRNEVEDFGTMNFYRHFGPLYFSFSLNGASFIVLDSTGKTPWQWQLRWLHEELERAADSSARFVILGHAMFAPAGFAPDDTAHILPEPLRTTLGDIFATYQVDTVFSAGYPTHAEKVHDGVRYVNSGGGGGLILDTRTSGYQFVMVDVSPGGVRAENVAVPHGESFLRYTMKNVGLFLHSFFSMSLFNFLVLLALVSLAAIRIYSLIIRQEHLYRDFSVDDGKLDGIPLRVAIFSNNYLPFVGGVPFSIERLFEGLKRQGTTVKLFAPRFPDPWVDPDDGSVHRVPPITHTRTNRFPVANVFSRRIRRAFSAFDPTVVHVHHPFWLGKTGLRLAKRRELPVVLTYHTRLEHYTHYVPFPGMWFKNIIAHLMIKRFANRCDAIITPTPSTEEYLRNLGVSSIVETIPTGIDLSVIDEWSDADVAAFRKRHVDSGERLLVSVSRMAREKNLDFLIDGLAKAANRTDTPFTCLLVGDGPEKERLERRVADIGMADRIIFTGRMNPAEVALCNRAADLFVFASTSETQGMVLLEAMAAGSPVVAVRASGVYDVIRNDENGVMVDESTDSWARAVAELISDQPTLARMGKMSREYAEEFSVERIAERVSTLYRRVMILNRTATTTEMVIE